MQRYDVIIHRFSPERVQSAVTGLVREFGLDAVTATALVQRVPRVVKRSQDYEAAERYRFALEALGATVELRPEAEETPSAVPFGHTPSIAPSLPPRPPSDAGMEDYATRWLEEPLDEQARVELAVPTRALRSSAPPPDQELRGTGATHADLWLMAVLGDSDHAAHTIAQLLHVPLRDAMEAVHTAPCALARNLPVDELRDLAVAFAQVGLEVKLRKGGSLTSLPPPAPDDADGVLAKIARWPWRKHPR